MNPSSAFEFDLRVPACAPAGEVARCIARAEAAGFSGAFLPEGHLMLRDVYIVLALAAERTRAIRLGVAATNIGTRHPLVTASAAATLEELAPGRIRIVLARSHEHSRLLGRRPPATGELRDAIVQIRRLLAGERVDFHGYSRSLRFAPERRPQIYLAGSGRQTLELAGEVADGVLAMVGLHPAAIGEALKLVAVGAARAGRDSKEVDVAFSIFTYPHEDPGVAYEVARPVCASWASEPFLRRWLRVGGLVVPDFPLPAKAPSPYPDLRHIDDPTVACEASRFMPDELARAICDRFFLVGPPRHWAARLREAARAGARHIFVRGIPTYTLPYEFIDAFEREVFPALGHAG